MNEIGCSLVRRLALLTLLLLLSACGGHMELAYQVEHAIASPRVPFYRYDDNRVIEVRYTEAGTSREEYWLNDRSRGIDRPLTHEPPSACTRFGGTFWNKMFNTFDAGSKPPVPLRPHYASDDAEVLVFAQAAAEKFWHKTEEANYAGATAIRLATLISLDGGRHFFLHEVLLNPPPKVQRRNADGPQYADYSDIPIRVDDGSEVHFIVVRAGVAYVGLGHVNAQPGVAQSDSMVMHQGSRIAVFAFDPRDSSHLPRARLLHGAELRDFALPHFDAGTHRTDEILLARARPTGAVVYDENKRRDYVNALRAEFPVWAGQQNIDIGRSRFATTRERSRAIEAAAKRGDPCAGWVPY